MRRVLVNVLRRLNADVVIFLLFFSVNASVVNAYAVDVIHHDIKVSLSPDKHSLSVTDVLTLPDSLAAKGKLELYLHAGLSPQVKESGVSLKVSEYQSEKTPVPLERLDVSLPPETKTITLSYQGEIYHPVEQLGAEYARSFSVSPGLISSDGIFLSGSSYWYARLTTELHTFKIEVQLPASWSSVSQGQRSHHVQDDDKTLTTWSIDKSQDEIYLIAAQFSEYSQASGVIESMVFLRKPDAKLAQKYLDTTAQYVEMYRQLLGTYPYKKFALVENFWETGYGMPSFTLLGPRVIRFPFILHSSYPHEILHNWWGNGVYVDYQTGNWAEGLTSYLADHLIKEQRGQAVNYRRNALQKYTDFVNDNRDFPLSQFRSRHNATTEAIGYGKTLMFFHMLRQQVGDVQFIRALQTFYRQYRFKYAGFDDIRKVFEDVTDVKLGAMFKQWVVRTGAPELQLTSAKAVKSANGYTLTVKIDQIQPDEPYTLQLPLSITTEGSQTAFQVTRLIDSKTNELEIELSARPLRLDVDPEFDLFRRLDLHEIPPALTKAFGAEKVLIVLPSKAAKKQFNAYQQLAQSWQRGHSGSLQITRDDQLKKLPSNRAVWLFGWSNLFRGELINALQAYDVSADEKSVRIDKTVLLREKHAVVMTARNLQNNKQAITWLVNDNVNAMPGFGRKLPHYGRYSYLGFTGNEPTNIAKGQWPVVNSPMSIMVEQQDGQRIVAGKVVRESRVALAQLPPVFSEKRLLADIQFIASEAMRGRGLATPEIDRAADYIAQEFKKAGLSPGGDKDSFFQSWEEDIGEPHGNVSLKNVVAVWPGSNPQWKQQSLIVSAHYDHLGLGWPDVHKGDEGKIHYGADDNASGVAIMLELARIVAKNGPLDRSIVFVAFTGEETGKYLGSRHYLQKKGLKAKSLFNDASNNVLLAVNQYPASEIMAMLNLDTVGRLFDNKLTVFGTGSAREWVHVFRGVGFVTGIDIQSVAADYGSSDQKGFLEAGIPAVQFFGGATPDYHRPTDTVDKIDSAGLVKIATVLKETVDYLTARELPLTSQLSNVVKTENSNANPVKGRRVTLGTVPDFAYQQKGVRISGVSKGTPAEQAGLTAGDVIIKLNGNNIDGLRDFAKSLRAMKVNDKLDIIYLRDGKQYSVSTHVIAR